MATQESNQPKSSALDIDICIKVAEIEGHNVTSDGISRNLIPCDLARHGSYLPVKSEGKSLTWFNPILNDALCYRLMLKYNIKVSTNREGICVAMFSHCQGEEHENPNKAVCLAIIAKQTIKPIIGRTVRDKAALDGETD